MSSAELPGTMRLKKPSWKDPRLLVGVLLVLASIAGVVALVRAADTSTPVFVARADIAVGQAVTPDLLEAVDMRLGPTGSRYVAPGAAVDGKVAAQRIAKGDLVPISSIASPDVLARKPVSITVAESLPEEAVEGTRVDIWVAAPDGRNGFAEPKLVVPAAEIAHLVVAQSAFGGVRETVVQVLVEDAKLPQLLGALANKAKVSVVWNPAGRRSE